ncbi:N-acetylglucosamine kinase [Salinibacillus xinjiangensis]|uniref:ATPase n=1 Tax=Salinibacillus xinjiangensis TaxID=1229268 RepID=A0A6G1X1S5_9BACI|nr:BadF/BadG/BcrA/BcrD ATPase family protein [Salinibacillus xinjiangensis]MRG84933.1 ATPase [Salinibacillus xinjiangensis]
MTFVIGIDGGGTKTTCLFSEVGAQSSYHDEHSMTVQGEGTNPQIIGFHEMRLRLQNLIRQGMEQFSIDSSEILGVCSGLAGVGRMEEEEKVKQEFTKISSNLKLSDKVIFSVHSDTYIALRGALKPDEREGILVISGTGSNATGMTKNGDVYKSGGWGHILGDEGSGFQISLKALNHITRAHDLRGKKTSLTDAILTELKLDKVENLVSYIYGRQHEKKDIARFAKLVIQASEQGDAVAIEILEQAAFELALHVESLFQKSQHQFHEQTPITTTGSIFTYSNVLKSAFIKYLETKKLGIYQPSYGPPAYGAAVIVNELVESAKKAR